MKTGRIARKLVRMFIAIALIACIVPFSGAQAASLPFKDVSETDYFNAAVTAMYEKGEISGYGNGTFLPQNSVSRAEALKLVCAAAGFEFSSPIGETEPWYTGVLSWAVEKGIVSSDIDPNLAATREEICTYIVAAFDISTETDSDVFSDTDSKLANTLYDYGVISGIPNGDGSISFGGEKNVKRGDACVMLYRLLNKTQSTTALALPTGTAETAAVKDTTVASNATEPFVLDKSHYQVSKPSSFSSYDDYVEAWRYMLANAVLIESFQLEESCTRAELVQVMNKVQSAFYFASFDYMEYYSFLNKWKVSAIYKLDENGDCVNPTITLRLSNVFGIADSEILRQISVFNDSCSQIVTNLYSSGSLKTSMTVKEKAYVLYRYLAYNTKYDSSYTLYSGYNAAIDGTAVCQGYTAMYNYLCNIAGVPMESMTGKCGFSGHAWSRIYCDGAWYNVDTTWSDPTTDNANYCDDNWFWVSDEFLKTASKPRSFDSDTLIYG